MRAEERVSSPGPKIVVDTSALPIVFHAMLPDYTDDDVAAMCQAYDELLRGQRRYAILVYFHPDAHVMKPTSRKRLVDWWQLRKERVATLNVAAVVVLRSGILRGALTAVQWIVQPRNPHLVVASAREGLDLCAAKLSEANIAIDVVKLQALRERIAQLP